MSILWFILIIIFFVALQARIYKRYAFKNLKIERYFESPAVFPGEKVGFHLLATNRKMMPLTWLQVEQKLTNRIAFDNSSQIEGTGDGGFLHRAVLALLPFQRVDRCYSVKGEKRGYIQLRKLTLETTNLFGTEKYNQELDISADLVVYPNLIDLKGTLIPANTNLGKFIIDRWIMEDPMMVTGIRDYMLTDSFRRINWKASAKNQKLYVNKYDFTADKKIMLLFNLESNECDLNKQDLIAVEKAIEIAASVSVQLIQSGIPVGFATNAMCMGERESEMLASNTGEKHVADILEAFAKVTYYKKFKSREILKLMIKDFSWGTEIIVVTPSVSSSLLEDLDAVNPIKTTVVSVNKGTNSAVPQHIRLFYYDEDSVQPVKEGESLATL